MLTRRAPMRRTPLRRRREEPRRSSYFAVPDYHAHLAALPCAFGRFFALACAAPIEVHHQREGAGAGLRRPDTHAIPACVGCHRARHAGTGPFARLSRHQRNHVERVLIGAHQAVWFGRALTDADLPTVRAAVEAGVSTFQMFATAAEPRGEAA